MGRRAHRPACKAANVAKIPAEQKEPFGEHQPTSGVTRSVCQRKQFRSNGRSVHFPEGALWASCPVLVRSFCSGRQPFSESRVIRPKRGPTLPTIRLPGRMARNMDSFRMPRKPGVERNHQIGHFDDMPTIRQLRSSSALNILSAVRTNHRYNKACCDGHHDCPLVPFSKGIAQAPQENVRLSP